jgi:hypothetical protein
MYFFGIYFRRKTDLYITNRRKNFNPRYISRNMEFHINEDYLTSKVEQLRQSNQLAVFEWDIEIPT